MTQGRIERDHRSMKNVVKLEHYNHHRDHASLNDAMPGDVFDGRDQQILSRREQVKQQTLRQRRIENRNASAV